MGYLVGPASPMWVAVSVVPVLVASTRTRSLVVIWVVVAVCFKPRPSTELLQDKVRARGAERAEACDAEGRLFDRRSRVGELDPSRSTRPSPTGSGLCAVVAHAVEIGRDGGPS